MLLIRWPNYIAPIIIIWDISYIVKGFPYQIARFLSKYAPAIQTQIQRTARIAGTGEKHQIHTGIRQTTDHRQGNDTLKQFGAKTLCSH